MKTDRKLTLRPLAGKCVVKLDDPKRATDSGILLPDFAREKPLQGTVLAVGPGRRDDDGNFAVPEVKAGDKVRWPYAHGHRVDWEGDILLVLNQEDLLAVLGD